ncbi:MAG: major facilitator superfamily 1 [Deltaproteobacteria bacterium]|nr:major facilitator superfamily 1 [Deltaproteobacteria bacterium]
MSLPSNLRSRFSNIYAGWVMVGLVSALRVLGGGLHGYGFTVFFLPVSQDLGLNRAQTSLAFSLARAEGAIEAPVIGYVVDRFGPRPLMVTAALLAGVGYIALSWVNNYAAFLVVYLGLISLAYSAGFIQTPMVIANNWFIRKRARAMTVVGSAVTIGGTLITPALAATVTHFGWRWGAFFAGCAFLIVGIPLSLKVVGSPETIGLQPDGDAPLDAVRSGAAAGQSSSMIGADVSARDALKTLAFWALAFSMLVRVGTQSTLMVHFIPIMVWKGMSQERAAVLLSAFALLNLLFHFLLGWIADRVNKPRLLSLWMIFPLSAIVILIVGESSLSLWLFAILYSALDAAFPVTWAISGDFFGRKHFATIRGNMTFCYMWGSALGPVIAGHVYDQTQGYESVLWGSVVTLSLSMLLTALLIKSWSAKIAALDGATVGATPSN